MMENTMKATNGYRRIVVSRNEVRISALKGKTENKEKESMTMKKQYQIINGIDLGEHQVVQCFGGGEITVFSITYKSQYQNYQKRENKNYQFRE